jgi:hypothetical protein
MIQIRRAVCERCHREKPITHVVESDIDHLCVCYDCALAALEIGGGGVGDMTVAWIG